MTPSLADACYVLFDRRPTGAWGPLSKAEFLAGLGLPDARWAGPRRPLDGHLELIEGAHVEVHFSEWDTGAQAMHEITGRRLCVGVVVLAAEELAARGWAVPDDIAAAASVALAEEVVVLARKEPR